MSGGAWNYACDQVAEWAERMGQSRDPMRRAFATHLVAVSKALHDVEWVDSGDMGDGDDHAAIEALIGTKGILEQTVVEARDVHERLWELLFNMEHPPEP